MHIYIFCRILLKSPNKPDKSLDKHKAVEGQAEHDWDCDYPNEDYYDSSCNFFKFENLSQILPKAGDNLVTPPETKNINSSDCESHQPHKPPLSVVKVLYCFFAPFHLSKIIYATSLHFLHLLPVKIVLMRKCSCIRF